MKSQKKRNTSLSKLCGTFCVQHWTPFDRKVPYIRRESVSFTFVQCNKAILTTTLIQIQFTCMKGMT